MSNYLFSTNKQKVFSDNHVENFENRRMFEEREANKNSPSLHTGEHMIPIPTVCFDIPSFQQKLMDNNGLIIFKFGATWCKPCKIVEPHYNAFYNQIQSLVSRPVSTNPLLGKTPTPPNAVYPIESLGNDAFSHDKSMRSHLGIECINIDVDDSFELYATMKRYKMVKGLPTFLAFYKGNNSYIAEESFIGSDVNQLHDFFRRSISKYNGFTGDEPSGNP